MSLLQISVLLRPTDHYFSNIRAEANPGDRVAMLRAHDPWQTHNGQLQRLIQVLLIVTEIAQKQM